jgi:SSS family solute:Na+ symporter
VTALDWSLVLVLNGGIILYGLYLSRGMRSAADWFLAGRQLPWWLVGLSMYATAIDASDLVADSGGTYTLGMSVFVANWVGVVGGWVLAGFFIFLPMYRLGMYTNAEYLEARFGVTVRVICAFVQVQYRTLVLAIIATTAFLTLTVVSGWDALSAWGVVGGIALLASIYTALGGLRSVAVTDALQFCVMTLAGLVIWFIVWGKVGGWSGVEAKLTAVSADLPAKLLHIGAARDGTPGWLVALAFAIIGVAYSVVNQTQAMRMFASRNEWHLKMSIFAASVPLLIMTFCNLSIGVMGRALIPEQADLPDANQDSIYPFLVSQIDAVGLKGLVVAGVFAAALSTYDSIGSSLSALLTRDVYARLIVRDRDDRHYLRVGQWLTPVIIFGSFVYVPFMLEGGMLLFYIDLTSAFVIPLLTLFLMGTLTRVHRRAGLVGLIVGTLYGVLRLCTPAVESQFGFSIMTGTLANSWAAYPLSMIISAATMVLCSLFLGWESRETQTGHTGHEEESPWLRSSQIEVQGLASEPVAGHSMVTPVLLSALVLMTGCYLSFVLFW